MSNLDDRKKAFEDKYAFDQETNFKIEARACKLFATWLAAELGMDAAQTEEFIPAVIGANLSEAGFDDVKRFVLAAIAEKGAAIDEATIDAKLSSYLEEARVQIVGE